MGRAPKTWLSRWRDGAHALADKTRKPMVAVVIDEQPDGVAAYSVHGASPAGAELAAKTLLGDIINSIGGEDYQPGRCDCCDERLARVQAAFALLEPDAEVLPGDPPTQPASGGKRELH